MTQRMENDPVAEATERLLAYGEHTRLIRAEERIFVRNRILDALALDGWEKPAASTANPEQSEPPLEALLKTLVDDACRRGVVEDTAGERDRLDTRIMGCLTPEPREVIARFRTLYGESPERATNWFYRLCMDCDYIRRYRMVRDVRWNVDSEYGELEMSINLAKPEKDPRDIAAARNSVATGYPRCLLCLENEGYAGRADFPARQTLRLIPLELGGTRFGFQYSPYVYYNEHCIVINERHTPMAINRETFVRLFDFLRQFPHYFIGSNADLPVVGGSILTHDHFQGGRHEFPMARAKEEAHFVLKDFPGVEAMTLRWPLSVIRLRTADPEELTKAGCHILEAWRGYSDASVDIIASTGDEPHNTITPIARMRGDAFELDLALRNNRATPEHPLGLFHPHAEFHHIKSENIGLIEVMGLAILPSRLKQELDVVADRLLDKKSMADDPATAKHAAWVSSLSGRVPDLERADLLAFLRREAGAIFTRVLECCGVFKRDELGRAAFARFMQDL